MSLSFLRGSSMALWLALGGGLMGCSPEAPAAPDQPTKPQSSEIQEALQKPINATGQAIDQVHDTQKRMDDALNELAPASPPPAPPESN